MPVDCIIIIITKIFRNFRDIWKLSSHPCEERNTWKDRMWRVERNKRKGDESAEDGGWGRVKGDGVRDSWIPYQFTMFTKLDTDLFLCCPFHSVGEKHQVMAFESIFYFPFRRREENLSVVSAVAAARETAFSAINRQASWERERERETCPSCPTWSDYFISLCTSQSLVFLASPPSTTTTTSSSC